MIISEKLIWAKEFSIKLNELNNCQLCRTNEFIEGMLCIKKLKELEKKNQ